MNRVFGTLCAIAIIAVVAFAIHNYGNYTSICFTDEPAAEPIMEQTEPQVVAEESDAAIIELDTTAIIEPDTLSVVEAIEE